MRPTPPRPLSMRTALLGAALLPLLCAAPAAAQMEGCEFGERGRNMGRRTGELGGIWYIGGPHFVCDDGSEIFADSVVIYEERGRNDLIGNVRYYAGTRQLFASEARYFTREGRLQASGNVRVIDEERGSTIENGDVVLLLPNGSREEEEMTVRTGSDGIRPRAVMLPPAPAPDTLSLTTDTDSLEAPPDTVPPTPYEVVSDRMEILGSGSFVAVGLVEIVRDSLFAWADSADYDGQGGGLDLSGAARVESAAYRLAGETIRMGAPGSAESTVEARRSARLTGDGIELTAAMITMFLRDDALERLVATPIRPTAAVGPGAAEPDSLDTERPWALVETFQLTADSLEVDVPAQRLERVFAAGTARSESTAGDSLNVELLPDMARTDWLEGDTIVVSFATETTDSEETTVESVRVDPEAEGERGNAQVESVVAILGARSLYRLPSSDSTAVPGVDPPAVHYVTGRQITIRMSEGEISDMEVIGQTRGVHLEPLARSSRATRTDTTAVTDTIGSAGLSAPVDTTTARGDTIFVQPRGGQKPAPTHSQPTDGESRRPENTPWIRP